MTPSGWIYSVWVAAAGAMLLAACSLSPGGEATAQNLLERPGEVAALASMAAPVESLAPADEDPPAETDLPPPQTVVINPTPSAEAPPLQLQQLAQGGCCPGAFWSPDGRSLYYLDRPDQSAPTGLWRIDIEGGAPQFATDRLGIYSPDLTLRAFLENGQTFVESVENGQRWAIQNGGRAVSFAPDSRSLAWTIGQSGPPLDSAQRTIWVSRFDGSQTQQVLTVTGGGFSGWLGSGRILVSGRPPGSTNLQVLWAVDIPAPGEPIPPARELARAERMRSFAISPDGGWLVYLVTFSDDPALNGLWLTNTATGDQRRLDLFGAYRWRDENRLLIIPLQPGTTSDQVWQIDATGGSPIALTDPDTSPFKIAGGDWSVSPDGRRIAFLSAIDNNLWLLELP